MRNEIRVWRSNEAWMVDWSSHDNGKAIRSLFGTDQLPTPFRPSADPELVREAIATRNPEATVSLM